MTNHYESLATDTIPILISYVDKDEYYRYMNREYEIWFGLPRDQVIGKTLRDVLGDQAYSTIQDKVKNALSGQVTKFEQEIQYTRAGTRWVEATYIPHRNPNQQVDGFVAFVQDISDRKKLETNAIAAKDLLYKTIIDSLPGVFIWVCDPCGNITYVNQYWVLETGIELERCVANGWLEAVHPDDREPLMQKWQYATSSGKPLMSKARFKTRAGYHTFDIKGQPIYDRFGSTINWVGTNVDIEMESREKLNLRHEKMVAEAANQAKSKFLAHMSHEIRTPLSAIIGYAELASQKPDLDNQTRHLITIIRQNSEHLQSLVTDILDVSRIEAGHDIEVTATEFSLPSLLFQLISMFNLEAERKGLELNYIEKTLLPQAVETDQKLLRQILINLLSNALKFTDSGRIELSAAFSPISSTVTFHVIDTGHGIPLADQTDIFEAFVQSTTGRATIVKGTGLGLTLSRHIARRLGGDLTLKSSEPGSGSCFELTIPVGMPPSERAPPESEPAPSDLKPKPLTGLRILLVDDNKDLRTLMATLLQLHGADTTASSNGQHALDLCQNQSFDLILMDIQMPGLDGHETVKRMRAAGIKNPIIALSADASREEREKSRRSGFDFYETKPIASTTLPTKVLQWIDKSSISK
jgi:PAS domain S-box-containing protein